MEVVSRTGEQVQLNATFQVTSCSKPLLSLGKLWRQGQVEIASRDGQLQIGIGRHMIPVHVIGNSLYIRVRLPQQVAGTADEEMLAASWQHPEAYRDAESDGEDVDEREAQVGVYAEDDPRALAIDHGPIHMDIESAGPEHTWASR
eukprot:6320773-Amphidinium_carterae.1